MKRIKYIFLILICILSCGCTKINTNLTINNDKSMILSVDLLMNDDTNSEAKEIFKQKLAIAKDNGYSIEEKAREFYGGYRISRRYDSIDEATYKGNKRIKLSDFGEKNFNYNEIFSIKKGLFKNKYTAYFDFESLVDKYSELGIKNEETTETKETTETTEAKEIKETSNNTQILDTKKTTNSKTNNQDITKDTKENEKNTNDNLKINTTKKTKSVEEYAKSSEYTFTLTLPEKPIYSNATEVSKDGLTLTWKFNQTITNEVNFSFKMKNKITIIIISSVSGLILLFGIIIGVKILINKSRRKDLQENKPIFRGYDESIRDVIEQNVGVPANEVKEVKQESKPIVEQSLDEEKQEIQKEPEFVPEISTNMRNLEQLTNYEVDNNKDTFLKDKYINNNQTPVQKEYLFVKNEEEKKAEYTPVKKEKQELDIPDMEELK